MDYYMMPKFKYILTYMILNDCFLKYLIFTQEIMSQYMKITTTIFQSTSFLNIQNNILKHRIKIITKTAF